MDIEPKQFYLDEDKTREIISLIPKDHVIYIELNQHLEYLRRKNIPPWDLLNEIKRISGLDLYQEWSNPHAESYCVDGYGYRFTQKAWHHDKLTIVNGCSGRRGYFIVVEPKKDIYTWNSKNKCFRDLNNKIINKINLTT